MKKNLNPSGRRGGSWLSFGLTFWFLRSGKTWFNLTFQPNWGISDSLGLDIFQALQRCDETIKSGTHA